MLPDLDPAFSEIMQTARDFSLGNELYYIDSRMLLLSILELTSLSLPLSGSDRQELIRRVMKDQWEQIPGAVMRDGNVPLTVDAEEMVNSATVLQTKLKHTHLLPEHLLLALLSVAGICRDKLQSVGFIFEDYHAYLEETWKSGVVLELSSVAMMPQGKPFRSKLLNWFYRSPLPKKEISTYWRLATYFFRVNHYPFVREYCQYILDEQPDHTEAISLLGATWIIALNYEAALPYFEKAAGLVPGESVYQQDLASCLMHTGHHERGISVLKQLLTTRPGDVPLLNNIGFSCLETGAYAEAIGYFDQAIAIDPEAPFPYNNKGYALLQTGNTAKALECILYSLQLHKGNAYAYRNLALLYLKAHKIPEAKEALLHARKYRFTVMYGPEVDELLAAVN
ncbi:tetratricopeptide repeat protein [Chitinophaga arvensicola]|uniref:Tetratricopeptide repeat-containing protein n=1 Tax=Chitinophaga arvensicola TaxID=29529 RepID=A0A1I0S608_9BACT|nr:tetratricopeptide repeat protein [Chitinophaga arvensicola]SEW50449.1 Tetratricopeptide repeat-containing protein [Chitinophaga arvensicola]